MGDNAAASQRILEMVAYAKTKIKNSEDAFNRAKRALDLKTSRSIDLFGSTVHSQVADIVRDTCRACNDLYASYQSLILTLDETCRPLLSNNPDIPAVKAVVDIIKELNTKSEIDVDFTASLNGSLPTDVAVSQYAPDMNCLLIQRYWEDRYATWPGRAEQEALERKLALEKRAKAQQDAKKQAELQQQAYKKKLKEYEEKKKVWETEKQRIEALREAKLQERLSALKQELSDELNRQKAQRRLELQESQAQLTKELDKANASLGQMGIFAFSAKKEAKAAIAAMEAKLLSVKQSLFHLDSEYINKVSAMQSTLGAERDKLIKELEQQFPIPKAPKKPVQPSGSSASSQLTDVISQSILDYMEAGKLYTVTDLLECPALCGLSTPKVSMIVNKMVPEYLEKVDIQRRTHFRLAE